MQYSERECLDAFVREMNRKVAQLGMPDSSFVGPIGIQNVTTPRDMLRCLVAAGGYQALEGIWNCPRHTAAILGPNAREFPLESTVVADEASHILGDCYPVIGGKTGTLSRLKARNLAVLVSVPGTDDRLGCVVMYADDPNGEPNNRFRAAKQAIDAALGKGDGAVCAAAAAVCGVGQEGLLFEKNAGEVKAPASMTKILTAMVALDHISDLEETVTFTEADIELFYSKSFYAGDLKPGDVITVRDALYAMFLPSSNAAALMMGRFAGGRILAGK